MSNKALLLYDSAINTLFYDTISTAAVCTATAYYPP